MASQLEHLRQTLARLDAEGIRRDNPFRQGVLAQIAAYERDAWRKANGGWWGENARFLSMPCSLGRK